MFERATDVCGHCGEPCCELCLVRPFGDRKPPMCIDCAMARSGVRSTVKIKPVSRRELRRRREAFAEATASSEAEPSTLFDALRLPDLDVIADSQRNAGHRREAAPGEH